MIAVIINFVCLFIWLLYETDWLRVDLMASPIKRVRPQFKQIVCHDSCNSHSRLSSWRVCPAAKSGRCLAYKLPARTITAWGSTMSFNAGCNIQRTRLLRDICKAQKSKALPHFTKSELPASCYPVFDDLNIEIKIDGKPALSVNGNYKRGMIKSFMKDYCYPGEGKIRLIKVGGQAYKKLVKSLA